MKLFAWDFHGTLEQGNINATHEVCKIVLKEFDKRKHVTFKEIDSIYGKPFATIFKCLSPASTDSEIADMVERAVDIGKQIAMNHTTQTPYASSVLREINKKGDKNVIISAMRQSVIPLYLEWTNLTGLFADVSALTPDEQRRGCDITEKKSKDLQFFREKYNPEHVIMIGDRELDIKAGKKAGATTFLFSPRNRNIETKADFVITDLREVLKVYDRF